MFYAINHFARDTPWLHSIVLGYANYGVVLFGALLLAGWWIARSGDDAARMVAALWAPIGVFAALAINQPIADAVGEIRPCNDLHGIVVLHCNIDPGFPSDHAVMAGAATVGLWLVSRRLGLLAVLASLAMGFSRIYIGAHYPQDVLAGFVLGAVVSLVGYAVARPLIAWVVSTARHGPLRVLIAPSGVDVVEPQARQ